VRLPISLFSSALGYGAQAELGRIFGVPKLELGNEFKKALVAQAFQPVPVQAQACG
jgi:hypothetical protein